MQLGYFGLGKMGLAQVKRLAEKGYTVVAYNRSEEPRAEAKKAGAEVTNSVGGVAHALKMPRIIWLMVPHAAVDEVLTELVPYLTKGDTVIDGGNSFYKHSMRRAAELAKKGINFLDCGTSGGPAGARNGACLMIGGEKKVFTKYEKLFADLSQGLSYVNTHRIVLGGSYAYVGESGAGHFVKMVHNGIEYGMMQSLAEGFEVMKRSPFKLPLLNIAKLYNKGSVIESRLVGWLEKAFKEYGEDLKDISGEVGQLGEGKWTVDTAKELGVPVKVIEDSLAFRFTSQGNPSYTGQVVSALRNQFGGHEVKKR